jgi:hypothetical protein
MAEYIEERQPDPLYDFPQNESSEVALPEPQQSMPLLPVLKSPEGFSPILSF